MRKGHTGVLENEQVLENQFVCFLRDSRNRLLQLVKELHTNVWMPANLHRASVHLESRSVRESRAACVSVSQRTTPQFLPKQHTQITASKGSVSFD